MTIIQFATALRTRATTVLGATGGVAPYTYTVLPGGAGGTIDASTGLYTAPSVLSDDPKLTLDTIQVIDSAATVATTTIAICSVLQLVCNIIATEMGLASDQVFMYNQKISPPTDSRLYIAVGVNFSKPFANNITYDGVGGFASVQSINVMDNLSFDIYSRSTQALNRKEEILLALGSTYAENVQEQNSFRVGILSNKFINLSLEEGAAIPYRFNIGVNVQYAIVKYKEVPYFDEFSSPEVNTDP